MAATTQIDDLRALIRKMIESDFQIDGPGAHVDPTAFMKLREGNRLTTFRLPYRSTFEERYAMAAALGVAVREIKPEAVATVFPAWVSHAGDVPPSQADDRKEVVVVSVELASSEGGVEIIPVIRTPEKPPTMGESTWENAKTNDESSGVISPWLGMFREPSTPVPAATRVAGMRIATSIRNSLKSDLRPKANWRRP
jgi:hypothetical protein